MAEQAKLVCSSPVEKFLLAAPKVCQGHCEKNKNKNGTKRINPYGQVRNSEYFIYQLTQQEKPKKKKENEAG